MMIVKVVTEDLVANFIAALKPLRRELPHSQDTDILVSNVASASFSKAYEAVPENLRPSLSAVQPIASKAARRSSREAEGYQGLSALEKQRADRMLEILEENAREHAKKLEHKFPSAGASPDQLAIDLEVFLDIGYAGLAPAACSPIMRALGQEKIVDVLVEVWTLLIDGVIAACPPDDRPTEEAVQIAKHRSRLRCEAKEHGAKGERAKAALQALEEIPGDRP